MADGRKNARRGRPLTLEDVARRAGVSAGTVSRALSRQGRVGPATRARVLRLVEQMGYRPNVLAQTLAGGKSRIIGMIVSNLANPFFLDIFYALEAEAHRHDLEVMVANTDYRPQRLVAALQAMLARRIAGLAVVVSEMDPAATALVTAAGVPVALYDASAAGENLVCVKTDYGKGMRRMVEYLCSIGHRRMAFIGHHPRLEPLHDRRHAFVQAMKAHSIQAESILAAGHDSPAGGYAATRQVLASGFRPSAVVCVNDFMALGAIKAVRDSGLDVPGDVSVTGYDDIGLAAFAQPALTTVRVPRTRVAHLIYQALTGRPEDTPAGGRDIVIEPELLLRDSTAPASSTPFERHVRSA
jgi:DNA-binding LacI/PurR family transcriptional regulator